MKKHTVKSCVLTCHACPSQWDIYTVNGDYIYVRYRWGVLRLILNDDECIYCETIGDEWSGLMTTEELQEHTKEILDWSLYINR